METQGNNQGNIGVFDSGLGGLSILKYLTKELPGYHFIYLADQANIPYGSHSPSEIVGFSYKITDFLIQKNCKLVVIACNTATSSAIAELRNKYSIPFVGIEPAIKPAVESSNTGHIGVLATKVTAEGQKLQDLMDKFAGDAQIHTAIGYGLVELVEDGRADTDEAEELLRKYLDPMLENNIDQLVLGCTHYSFLINRIRKIVGDKVNIIDPTIAVVHRVKQVIEEQGILPADKPSEPEIYTSGTDIEKVKEFYRNI
ncbi:MAG: glutamate racemase [bacterium]